MRALEAFSLLESAPQRTCLRPCPRLQRHNLRILRYYTSTSRRRIEQVTPTAQQPPSSSQPPSPTTKPSKPTHHNPPPPPTFNLPRVPILTGRVTRTGTMSKTVHITRQVQTFDKWLQKHYTRPQHSLVHDPYNVLLEGDVIRYGVFESSERRTRIDAKRGLMVKYELKGVVTPFGVPLAQREAWRRSPEGRSALLVALQARQEELSLQHAQTVDEVENVGAVARREALEAVRESARRAFRDAELIERDGDWRVLFNNVFGTPRPLTKPEQRAAGKLGDGVQIVRTREEMGEIPWRVRERAGLR